MSDFNVITYPINIEDLNITNDKAIINDLKLQINMAEIILGTLICDLEHKKFHKQDILYMLKAYFNKYRPDFDYKNTTFKGIQMGDDK